MTKTHRTLTAVGEAVGARDSESTAATMSARQIVTRGFDLVLFVFIWGITPVLTLIIVPSIHESGHAAACLIEGGEVTQWRLMPFGMEPHTTCTRVTPLFCGAGSFASIVAWLFCTYIFSRQVGHLGTGHLFNFVASLWFWWSIWVFGELLEDAFHAYSDVPLHHDAGYFVRLTGINPTIASATMFALVAILIVPFLHVGARTLKSQNTGKLESARQ